MSDDDRAFLETFQPPEEGPALTDRLPPAEAMGHAADTVDEFNRLLWSMAKTLAILTAMLLMVALLVIAYHAAEFMVTV